MPEKFINYAVVGGYSELDGLGEGRWVPRPGTAGIQDWVGEVEMHKKCASCRAVVSERATRCAPCRRRRGNEIRQAKRSAA